MNNELRKYGFTLVELLVVITIIAMLVAMAIPASRAITASYNSSGAQSMINSAMSSARAIAAKERHYAGIRFQNAYFDPNMNPGKSIVDAPQYMIFIIYDSALPPQKAGNLGCRRVEGMKPIKLPDNLGVMDLYVNNTAINQANGGDSQINSNSGFTDTTTFSILFSPSGKLIIHSLWVRNKDGVSDDSSTDDIFNSTNNVRNNGVGMFIEDYAANLESSRNGFVIYDKTKFKAAYNSGNAWTDYLGKQDSSGNYTLPRTYINPYTGTIIEK